MEQHQVLTRDHLLQFLEQNFKSGRPPLQHEFYLKFNVNDDVPNRILLQSFDFPALGIGWSLDQNYGYIIPVLALNTIKFNYFADPDYNLITQVREKYFSDGLLSFPSTYKDYLSASIICMVGNGENAQLKKMISFTGIRFSVPVAAVNPTSSELSQWSCEMLFDSFDSQL